MPTLRPMHKNISLVQSFAFWPNFLSKYCRFWGDYRFLCCIVNYTGTTINKHLFVSSKRRSSDKGDLMYLQISDRFLCFLGKPGRLSSWVLCCRLPPKTCARGSKFSNITVFVIRQHPGLCFVFFSNEPFLPGAHIRELFKTLRWYSLCSIHGLLYNTSTSVASLQIK